jgi:hypothetical protein
MNSGHILFEFQSAQNCLGTFQPLLARMLKICAGSEAFVLGRKGFCLGVKLQN